MSTTKASGAKRRESVERNIYRRADGKLELGYRDSTGTQRWRVVAGGITAARAERDAILGAKGKGEHVQPNPRLRFEDAADRWLAEQVSELRPGTQTNYANSIRVHLKPRWGRKRLDSITVDDAARLVRELRAEGKAEWSISTVLRAAGRVFKFSQRRMNWHGHNPIPLLENGERPRTSETQRRRIFEGDELAQTLAVALDPYRLLFTLAAVTGARLSELLGLVWADVDLSDPDAAEVRFAYQADRAGKRVALKTEESRRTVEIPRQLASLLLQHQAASLHSTSGAFVFATRSGRSLGQRNVLRELRRAMTRATDERGRPLFPVLHVVTEHGRRVLAPRGSVPNFHSFRHTAASEAIAAGDVEEVSWQLGHKNSVVTRTVYRHEIKNAERTARRRAKMEARYGPMLGSAMEAADRSDAKASAAKTGEIVDLTARRSGSK